MSYEYYLNDFTLEELEIFRQLYKIKKDDNKCKFTLRELSIKCDKRICMNKDKLSKIIKEMNTKGIVKILKSEDKKTLLEITIKDYINK